MDSIMETPMKRRRTETGYVSSSAFNSQNDSGDDLFADYETIATIPLPEKSTTLAAHGIPSSPPPYSTQPTQILDRSTQALSPSGRKPSLLQVAASSPLKSSPAHSLPAARKGGILANAMAPPGTAFRLPLGVAKKPTKVPVIDLSDDELSIRYQGGSSDDESQGRASIKPSTFIQRAQKMSQSHNQNVNAQSSQNNGLKKFNEITSKSFYKPLNGDVQKRQGSALSGSIFDSRNRDENNTSSRIPAPKRSADVMANAYGSSSRPLKQIRQTGPAKAAPIEIKSLDEVPDFSMREKIRHMQAVAPAYTVDMCYGALLARKGNTDDAYEFLSEMEARKEAIDLTISEDERTIARASLSQKPPAKQQLKAPSRTIQEKYTSTQSAPRTNLISVSSPAAPPTKARRRLVQGRKNPSSPIATPPKAPTPVQRQITPESADDSDSGIGSEVAEDPELDKNLLTFFNTCSIQDLADIAAITEQVASLVLAQKPFKSLDQVRQVSTETPSTNATSKRKLTRRPVGEKIVDTCETMWTGYEAVDELVRRCEALGKPVAEAMQKWGVNVYGAAKDGELDLVSFDDVKPDGKRDSGIGTPSSTTMSADEEGEGDIQKGSDSRARTKPFFFPQPSIMASDITLKDYQVVGINWLSLLFENKLSCILADDMGLGKTCQVIAFLASLFEKGVKGPHLVIVPGSTLENWLREFQTFCPMLTVMPYYAGIKERPGIREDILESLEPPNVIVTTYGIAKVKEDNKFLRRLKPCVCVFDEGHHLKNSKSAVYEQLMRIPAEFRLLLTGTPLQNNLIELASLLGFILPAVFKEHSEDLEAIFSHKAKTMHETHTALLSAQRIARAKSMMTPFILRRKKYQVLKHLPTKTRRLEHCELTPSQYEIYTEEQARARKIIEAREAGEKTGQETTNIMMNLRKASIHPLLFRRLYDDEKLARMAKQCVKEEEYRESDIDLVYEDMTVMTDFELHTLCSHHPDYMNKFVLEESQWFDSGKVSKLCELLKAFKANGDRVLVFSQFTMVLDVLEWVLESIRMQFFRLDGQTDINDRQNMIDQFYAEEQITVFLLSTKAGGAGINLACANKVIIFDSSFNPQDDIQAENRAHRVGQTREVEVIRLVTKGTIEEQIYALGETKLALDDRVAGEVVLEEDAKRLEKLGEKAVQDMFVKQIKGENVSKG